jgi:hypothetical protein
MHDALPKSGDDRSVIGAVLPSEAKQSNATRAISGPGDYVTAIRARRLGAELIGAFRVLIENPVMMVV